jgi:hypothetical protein
VMAKRAAAVAYIGRPRAITLDLDALPTLRPFGSARTADIRERSGRPSLEFRFVA